MCNPQRYEVLICPYIIRLMLSFQVNRVNPTGTSYKLSPSLSGLIQGAVQGVLAARANGDAEAISVDITLSDGQVVSHHPPYLIGRVATSSDFWDNKPRDYKALSKLLILYLVRQC